MAQSNPSVILLATSACHRCLHNEDIISDILNRYPQGGKPEAENQNLLNVALACKALKEPALNELWRELHSLTPLLRLLPFVKLIGGTYVFTGMATAVDWGTFDQYADRVRAMSIQTYYNDGTTVDPSVYLKIARMRDGPILPRLRMLFCVPLFSQATTLISPFLRYIWIESDDTRMATAFLSTVASNAKNIERLRVNLTGPFHPSMHTCLMKFCDVPKLDLALINSPLAAYIELDKVLAQSQIKFLTIIAPDQWERDICRHALPSGFVNLKDFSVEGGFEFINAAISRVESTTLSNITIGIPGSNPSPLNLDWKPLVGVLFNRWSSLQELIFDLQYTSAPISARSLFDSLSNVRSLTKFSLSYYWPITIHDRDILFLAQRCPELQCLVLHCGKHEENVAPTISCLPYLALNCQKLVVVEMSMSSRVELPFEVPFDARGNKSLRVLYIRGMPLSPDPQGKTTRAIARLLHALFARLERVFNWTFFTLDPCWNQVQELLMKLQADRDGVSPNL
ncbi:hypothetical protein C8R43DRAFT_948101 [Mycena crocata]|nr:hypothetical protein C8R43DRAFT_948101 [Mycena crocata]